MLVSWLKPQKQTCVPTGVGCRGSTSQRVRRHLGLSRLCAPGPCTVPGPEQLSHVSAELDNCVFVELALLLWDGSVLEVSLLLVPTSALPPGRCLCSCIGEKPHF